jgi:hypothetical protein
MTLVEAVAHIQSAEKCSSLSAQVQLKRKIGEDVAPVKWADSHGPCDIPNVADLARSQLVLSGPGLAPGIGSLRSLLVLRSAVRATWPQTSQKAIAPESAQSLKGGPTGRAVKEDKEWMTLVEAIDHIRMIQDCDSMEALRQLKGEVGDGMIRIGWADSQGPNDRPDVRSLSTSQLLLWGTGIALDEAEQTYRRLLVNRSDVQRLWSLNKSSEPPRPTVDLSHDAEPLPTPSDAPRNRSEAEVQNAVSEIYADPVYNTPNEAQLYDILKIKLPGIRRKQVRAIAKQFPVRRPPGNQPKP